MTHWMSTAAKRAGLPGADRLSFEPGTSVKDAWAKACQVCEMPPGELAQAIASAFSMEAIDLGTAEPTAARLLPGSVARKFCIFPVRDENRYLVVATPNPADPNADQEVGFSSGRLARFAVAPPTDIAGAIESTYTPDVATESLLAQLGDRGDDTSIERRTSTSNPCPPRASSASARTGCSTTPCRSPSPYSRGSCPASRSWLSWTSRTG